jgi:hypothetical protein
MAKYDKFGVGKDGSVNKLRKRVSGIMHIFSLLGPGAVNREMADDLYRTMKTGKSYGMWTSTGGGKGGNKEEDDKDNGKGNGKGGGIGDVDFNMKGEMRPPPAKPPTKGERVEDLIGDTRDPSRFKMGRNVIPDLPTGKTMKQGGLVRGAGCAQRGRGKGKMV